MRPFIIFSYFQFHSKDFLYACHIQSLTFSVCCTTNDILHCMQSNCLTVVVSVLVSSVLASLHLFALPVLNQPGFINNSNWVVPSKYTIRTTLMLFLLVIKVYVALCYFVKIVLLLFLSETSNKYDKIRLDLPKMSVL